MVIQLVKKLQLRSIDHPILQPRSPIKKKKKRNCSIVQSDGNGSANLPIVDRIVSHHRYHRLHSSIREHTVEQSVPEKTTLPHLPFSHPPHLLTRLDFTWNESARSSRRWWRHSINRYINIISAFARDACTRVRHLCVSPSPSPSKNLLFLLSNSLFLHLISNQRGGDEGREEGATSIPWIRFCLARRHIQISKRASPSRPSSSPLATPERPCHP